VSDHSWRIAGAPQHYAWGDPAFLPTLLGRAPTGQPVAELWYGAHPQAPSPLVDGAGTLLDLVVHRDMAAPAFLLKLLAAVVPLSIQVHPSAAQAAAGFARENEQGLPLDAPERTYRDPNPKPELLVALTPFVAACGFRSLDRTRELFAELGHVDLGELRRRLDAEGTDRDVLHDVVGWLLRRPPDEARLLAASTVVAAGAAGTGSSGSFELEREWVLRTHRAFPGDIGVVVALLLNHVELAPGDGLFLDAGNLHAYLNGAGVEIMASSDNVVRGGLTAKHIDIDELLRIVDCTPIDPVIQPAEPGVTRYRAPTPWFALERHERGGAPLDLVADGTEIVLATEGSFATGAGELTPGMGLAIRNDADMAESISGDGVLWRAMSAHGDGGDVTASEGGHHS
jgi:mannose-6-phosphate isomerase